MDKFQGIFIAEAEELLNNLEGQLLGFEQNLNNEQSVKEIFRIMHTLKGGAGMFGFDHLSELTHELETIYDRIREGEIAPSNESFDITLQATDHLKALLNDRNLVNATTKVQHSLLMNRVKAFLAAQSSDEKQAVSKSVNTYYIGVELIATIFSNGTNPLYLVDDVAALGQSIVLPSLALLPEWDDIDPAACYTAFEILLTTTHTVAEIQDVFLFAEGQCNVSVELIGQADVLSESMFREWLSQKDIFSPALGVILIKNKLHELSTGNLPKETTIAESTVLRTKNENSIRVASDKLDEMMSIVSELVTMQARLSLLAGAHVSPEIVTLSEDLEKITRRLRDNAFSICLVPVETITTRFQRLVRDLAGELGKEVKFTTSGTETELDKSIMERITDPILHIIRNGLDHGIELPHERQQLGKPKHGTLHLEASQVGTMVYIRISDDGKGIDVNKVKQKAVARRLIDEATILSEEEILQLVFEPGFSTAEKITDISGRGVGMDIVKRNIEELHGTVSISSIPGKGTTVTIQLPLTLSITDGLLTRLGESEYIIPVQVVEKCYEVASTELENRIAQRLVLDGEMVPVFNLHTAFKVSKQKQQQTIRVIKLRHQHHHAAITVDDILGEYQAVMKPLGEWYSRQDEFSGATILGNGSVALVLDVDKLLNNIKDHKTEDVFQVNQIQ